MVLNKVTRVRTLFRNRMSLGSLCLCLLTAFVPDCTYAVTESHSAPDTIIISTVKVPPLAYMEGGKVTGVAVDITTEALNRLNQPFEIRIYPPARAQVLMQSGEVDATFPFMKTTVREEFAEYPEESLIEHPTVFFARKGEGIRFGGDFKKLSPYTFAIIRGSSYSDKFVDAMEKKLITKIIQVTDQRQVVRMLMNRRVDIVVGTRISLAHRIKQMGYSESIEVLSPPLDVNSKGYLVFSKKSSAKHLLPELDRVLREMKLDGSYQAIMLRYDLL